MSVLRGLNKLGELRASDVQFVPELSGTDHDATADALTKAASRLKRYTQRYVLREMHFTDRDSTEPEIVRYK